MNYKLLLFVFTLLLINCKSEKKVESKESKVIIENYVITEGSHCFKQEVEKNTLLIKLNVEGDKVHGTFDYLPFEGNEDKGNFIGELKDNIAKTICTFDQKDRTKKEEVIFKIDGQKISILGGEKKEIDGIWKFVDDSKGFYMNEIERISCD